MNVTEFFQYIWHRLPILLIFSNSYLVYRILVSSQLTDLFVQRLIIKSQGNISRIILYVLISGALLSFFIPNAVSVLILLPVLKQIEKQITESKLSDNQISKISTALGLSAIYGTNIGGMGSLVGSPANLILIGALDVLSGSHVPSITFLSWFIWSIPLVFCFLLCAYCVIQLIVLPRISQPLYCHFSGHQQLNLKQKEVRNLFILFIVFWIFHSICHQRFDAYHSYQSYICLTFVVLFTIRLFQKQLLSIVQLMHGVPFRGFMVLILFVCLMIFVSCFHLDHVIARFLNETITITKSPTILVAWVTGISIILTEFLSNTIVSTAMFPIVYQTAQMNDMMPLILMIPVSVASTCAFMTPIATPCNAFVFGEIKNIRLRTMMFCGMILNILCVLCVTIWIPFCIPLIEGGIDSNPLM
jgi:sodium-dependent dicarboxylate transporter 2/3/5